MSEALIGSSTACSATWVEEIRVGESVLGSERESSIIGWITSLEGESLINGFVPNLERQSSIIHFVTFFFFFL